MCAAPNQDYCRENSGEQSYQNSIKLTSQEWTIGIVHIRNGLKNRIKPIIENYSTQGLFIKSIFGERGLSGQPLKPRHKINIYRSKR